MKSSYRIIKNSHIDPEQGEIALINTNIDIPEKFNNLEPRKSLDEVDKEALVQEIKYEANIEIEMEKEEILRRARLEAEDIKQEAEKTAYEDGYKLGYEDGMDQGLNKAMNEALKIKKRALDLITQSEEYVENYYRENQENLIDLAITMAESIVHRKIDASDEGIMMLLQPLLREYAYKENIVITCHPDNIQLLKDKLEEVEEISGDNKIVVLRDSNLEKNGCTLENSQQVMDLQIKTQLENILKDIKNME